MTKISGTRPWQNTSPLKGFEPFWQGQFANFDDWVSNASSSLTGAKFSNGSLGPKGEGVPAICIDAKGRRCAIGADFERARRENAFPVRYFWSLIPSMKWHKVAKGHFVAMVYDYQITVKRDQKPDPWAIEITSAGLDIKLSSTGKLIATQRKAQLAIYDLLRDLNIPLPSQP